MAKRFFYVCAGIFLLALTYHLGARSAGAQAPGNPVVGCGVAAYGGQFGTVAVTANGDFYVLNNIGTPRYNGNIFGTPTSTTTESWGAVKDKYRK